MFDILKKLVSITAPSGSEALLYDEVKKEIEPFVDEIMVDALGNLIAHKKGAGKRVMFSAHLDEIGLIATYITDEGFVRVAPIGGVSPYYAVSARVKFTNGQAGVVSVCHSSDNTMKNLKLSDLYVDIGAKSKEEAQKMVAIGDTAGFVGEYQELGDMVVAKSLDDRSGCAALIYAIKNIKQNKNDLYFVFSYGEELGLRGAKTAAYSISPDIAVAVDVTKTGDALDNLKMAVALSKGAAIKIKDASILCHPYIKKLMFDVAEKYNILHQAEVLEQGSTDAGAIHLTKEGCMTGGISIPARYIHSPAEMICKSDLMAAGELIVKLIEEGLGE